METSEWIWKSSDGLDMYARGWVPQGKPKAVLVLLHGHGEHIGRYEHVAAALTENGYCLFGFDLRGHGKSGGRRGFTPSYEALLDDIAKFLSQVRERYPGLPCFLYGHSLGGNLAIYYVMRRKSDLKGAIATGAWLKTAYEPAAYQLILGKVMRVIYPGFTQPTHLKTKDLSCDPLVVEKYENDPLVHESMSGGLYFGIRDSGLWALEHAAEFPLPMLMMNGADDRIISALACQEFAGKAGEKVTFKLWDSMCHEIHNELEKKQVLAYMINWLEKNLQN
jgi:alpha-beta hydrolase superfamily lysophospholipase